MTVYRKNSVRLVASPEADIRAILNGFKFDESMWQMKIEELSEVGKYPSSSGQDAFRKPNLLVLDEPTNHLDIETIAWLENLFGQL